MKRHALMQSIYILMTLACMLVIFLFSAQDAVSSQNVSDGLLFKLLSLLGIVEQMGRYSILIRKLAHFILYFALGVSSALMFFEKNYGGRPWRLPAHISAAVFCLVYAFSDELHQYFVPGRSMELRDVALDFAGAVTAIVLVCLIRNIIFKHREERKEYEQASSPKTE